MTIDNYCKGCFSYFPEDKIQCAFSFLNIDAQCPCTNCVVKVMCNNACTKYVRFNLILEGVRMIKES